MSETEAAMLRRRLQESLHDALRRRDPIRTTALRSALSAIDNAESVSTTGDRGPKLGVGAADVMRRHLSRDDLAAVLGREIEERISAAATYERAGRRADASRLRAEAAAIEPFIAG